jgi:hypothetical protein
MLQWRQSRIQHADQAEGFLHQAVQFAEHDATLFGFGGAHTADPFRHDHPRLMQPLQLALRDALPKPVRRMISSSGILDSRTASPAVFAGRE